MASSKATGVKVNLQNNTDRTVYATWSWSKKNTDHYSVKWYYATGNGIWFIGNKSTVNAKQSVYNAPSNATKVKFCVKPVSKTHKVNNKDTNYWTASWSTAVQYEFAEDHTPAKPSAPTVKIDKYKLTAELNTYDQNTKAIEFQVVKNNSSVVTSGIANVVTNHAAFSCNVAAGNEYKVRCRGLGAATAGVDWTRLDSLLKGINGNLYGDWSEYSSYVGTIPNAPTKITKCVALSKNSVRLEWSKVSNATDYEVEYTSNKEYFDSSNEVSSMSVNSVVQHAEITGLDSGRTWFFRVRAKNDQGESAWTGIAYTVLGSEPSAPTTWSSTTTGIVGEQVTLYWVHNSEDGSKQTSAQIELSIAGASSIITAMGAGSNDEEETTYNYVLNTSSYSDGAEILWRVRTKGILDKFSEWSIQRTINVYAPPVLELSVGNEEGPIDVLTSFPLPISATAEPESQTPTGYYLSISSNEAYQKIGRTGRLEWVNAGEEVYSKYFDITDHQLSVAIMPSDVELENNVTYTLVGTVSMSSGLTASATYVFTVSFEDEEYAPDAEIGINNDDLTAYIKAYCEDEEGNLIDDVLLSVYRREFDGTFTELATDLDNSQGIYVTDPHPGLDYARYRIVAMSKNTGAIGFYDPPPYPVGETAIIIQWDEEWSNFAIPDGIEDDTEEPAWSGSLLRLPYNIDTSEDYKGDVSLVKYIGRTHPVSYYGTQIDNNATWNVDIERDDEETLYALRRLAVWMGDVYVREPSGCGYWAQVSVSFSQKHCELTIPVTLSIKRVEGGA